MFVVSTAAECWMFAVDLVVAAAAAAAAATVAASAAVWIYKHTASYLFIYVRASWRGLRFF